MASIQEIKAQIEGAKHSAQQAVRALAAVNSQLDTAIQQIQAAAQGTSHDKVKESLAGFHAAKEKVGEVQSSIGAGVKSASDYQSHI
ncbi:MAG: hypothetical protein WCA46_00365 [Actinocatenispora sp.]